MSDGLKNLKEAIKKADPKWYDDSKKWPRNSAIVKHHLKTSWYLPVHKVVTAVNTVTRISVQMTDHPNHNHNQFIEDIKTTVLPLDVCSLNRNAPGILVAFLSQFLPSLRNCLSVSFASSVPLCYEGRGVFSVICVSSCSLVALRSGFLWVASLEMYWIISPRTKDFQRRTYKSYIFSVFFKTNSPLQPSPHLFARNPSL